MPKRKQSLEPRMDSRSRRAASKVALMQMQKLTSKGYANEPETLEILSDDDGSDVVPIEPPPKKKYKLTHKKSSDGHDRDVIVLKTINAFSSYKVDEQTLTLDCWPEELSQAQLVREKNVRKEWEELNREIENYVKNKTGQLVYNGDSYTVYDASSNNNNNQAGESLSVSTMSKSVSAPRSHMQSIKASTSTSVKFVMDVNSGMVLGTMLPTNLLPAPVTSAALQTPCTRSSSPMVKNKKGGTTQFTSKLIKISADAFKQKELQVSSADSRNSRDNVVDLTREDISKNTADSREVSFCKMQGKTFPSLVVVARPLLNVSNFNSNRAALDTRVKSVLMYPPTKFTEWLIQQGLLRSEQTCVSHPENKLKLGIYSDTSKFTVSGGYVWVADCCPSKFISVFQGSIFEGTTYSSAVMLKLIYHWACQTLVQNVIQWVKVDNLYLKGMYTWLRAVCTVALHTHVPKLGGAGVKVEVGVISLGTTSQDGNQRQVKVEVLGVLETVSRRIRLRAVEPLDDTDRNYKKRFMKILEPLISWVHPESFIITDLTVDKHTLISMGFKYVHQATSADPSSNNVIMEYLRKVVPRMFQNTLSLLSRHIIQQFLDELVWREWYGSSAHAAFDNIIAHIGEQTKIDHGVSLIIRFNKVSINPFKNWSLKAMKSMHKPSSTTLASTSAVGSVLNIPINANKKYHGKKKLSEEHFNDSLLRPSTQKLIPLEQYYYGSIAGDRYVADFYPTEIDCTICNKKTCKNNIEMMDHVFLHATKFKPTTLRPFQCRYCLSTFKHEESLNSHIHISHPVETKLGVMYSCLICSYKTKTTIALGKHMSTNHVRSELPYKCEVCGFRTSAHREIVNHFYKVHVGSSQLQCPFCLKTTILSKQKRIPCANVFLHHVANHVKKGAYKKCGKCALTFLTKAEYSEHTTKMHTSLRGRQGLVKRIPKHGNSCLIPLHKTIEEDDEITDLKSLVIDIDSRLKCIECHEKLTSPLHFPSVETCSNNCQYQTCCKKAMKNHKCKQLNAILPNFPLPFDMYCICGFSGNDGNAVAKHLAVCERKSAYPSLESAQAATVTHSMLDVLGLVRKSEEPTTSTVSVNAAIADSNQSKIATDTNQIDEDVEIIESDDNVSVDNATMQQVMDIIDKHTEDDDDVDKVVVNDGESQEEVSTDKTITIDDEQTETNDEPEKATEKIDDIKTLPNENDDKEVEKDDNMTVDENNSDVDKTLDVNEDDKELESNEVDKELERNVVDAEVESNEVDKELEINKVDKENNEENKDLESNEEEKVSETNAKGDDTENLLEREDEASDEENNSEDEQDDALEEKAEECETTVANNTNANAETVINTEEFNNDGASDEEDSQHSKDTENVEESEKETSEILANIQNNISEMDVDNDGSELNEAQNTSETTSMDVDDNTTEGGSNNEWNNIGETSHVSSELSGEKENFAETKDEKNADASDDDNDEISKEYAIDDSGLIGNDKLLEF